MGHTRRILVAVAGVIGIEEGGKTIAMTMIVAMVIETTTVEEVVEVTTMIGVDHPNVVIMV